MVSFFTFIRSSFGIFTGSLFILISTFVLGILHRKKFGTLELPIYTLICSLSIFLIFSTLGSLGKYWRGYYWYSYGMQFTNLKMVISNVVIILLSMAVMKYFRIKKLTLLNTPTYGIISLFASIILWMTLYMIILRF